MGRRRSSRFWHSKFGIAPQVRVVLHAGSVAPWTGIDEIVSSVRSWPDDWVLVIHTRQYTKLSSEIERLRRIAAVRRVYFSVTPVARENYDELIDGADIGIAFYVPTPGSPSTQLNLRVVGLSSGKVAHCLRAGLPVIVNEGTTLGELVTREGCGITVQESGAIGRAIAQIAQRYLEYSERACRTFNRYFEFASAFQEVLSRLDNLRERQL